MTEFIRRNQKGFTLIELMIVVAIIGILTAIAIPNFMNYQLKAKTAEAKNNIGYIKTCQEMYKSDNGEYLACTASPNSTARGRKMAWASQGGFTTIGYSPTGSVFYNYQVTVGTNGGAANVEMFIGASADLNSDNAKGEFGFITSTSSPPGTPGIVSSIPDETEIVIDLTPGEF